MTSPSQGADAPSTTGSSRSALLWVIGGLGVAGLFLWCLLVIPGSREAYPTGDGAVIELYTLLASRGWWEYGPYSRWGWHHPGPLVFYVLAAFYKAAHEHSLAINAGSVAINLIAVTTILWALARHASATLTVAVAASLAVFLWRLPPLLVSAWNPHLVLLPLAALIATASVTAAGRLSLLPMTIVMASFVAQTHIGLLPPAAIVTAFALAAGLITGRASSTGAARGRWFWLGVSALAGFVLWLPPIVEQVTNADGNLSKIVRFFLTEDPADPTAPFMQAVRVWAAAVVDPFGPGLHFAVGGLLAREASTPIVVLALFIVALLIAAGWRTRGPAPHPSPLPASGARESASPLPFEGRGQGEGSQLVDAWFCRICAVASLAAMFAMSGVRQGFGDYMVIWISAIGVMNGAALMAWLFTSIASRVATVPVRSVRSVRWIVPVVTCTVLIAATTHGALDLERLRAERAAAARNGDFRVRGESIYVALRTFLAKARVRRPLIRVAGTWDNASALALQLHKRRQPVAISDDAIWLVGPQFKRDGTEDADLTLADRSERQAVTARDGDCMLIERHGLSLHVLVPSLHTTITLTCE